MPPKAKKVTKGEEKKKAKVVEDKTFGLKNKNRSAQVQKFVQSTQKQHMGDVMARKSAATAEKIAKKEAKATKEAELKALGLLPDAPKKDEAQFKSSAEAEDYLWTAEDFDYVADETTLEEQLQKELDQLREDLATGKKKGTPVNPETFAAWEEKRRKEAEKALRKAQATFKKTGGGMTGRALFEFDATLFKDDEGAAEVRHIIPHSIPVHAWAACHTWAAPRPPHSLHHVTGARVRACQLCPCCVHLRTACGVCCHCSVLLRPHPIVRPLCMCISALYIYIIHAYLTVHAPIRAAQFSRGAARSIRMTAPHLLLRRTCAPLHPTAGVRVRRRGRRGRVRP